MQNSEIADSLNSEHAGAVIPWMVVGRAVFTPDPLMLPFKG